MYVLHTVMAATFTIFAVLTGGYCILMFFGVYENKPPDPFILWWVVSTAWFYLAGTELRDAKKAIDK